MKEIEHEGVQYRIGRLDAFKQFHVVRRISPLLAKVLKASRNGEHSVDKENFGQTLDRIAEPLTEALAGMSDETAEYVIKTCLGAVSRKQAENVWAPVCPSGVVMFKDIDAPAMLNLTFHVVQENLSGFFHIALNNSEVAEAVSTSSK